MTYLSDWKEWEENEREARAANPLCDQTDSCPAPDNGHLLGCRANRRRLSGEIDHVRAATERAILRERVMLHALFAPRVATALERYYSETMLMGMPTDAARNDLAEILAERGLADPDGRATVTTLTADDSDVKAAWKLHHLDISLAEFSRRYHEQRRLSIRAISAREYAQHLALEPGHARGPLRSRLRWVRIRGRRERQKRS